MQEWIISAIGVGGTLAGAGVGYTGALAISRRDRAAALWERIRAALAIYLGALYASVAELRDLPPNREPNCLDRSADALRGKQGAWLARRRSEFRLAGDRYRQLAERLAAAEAQLQVSPLRPDLRAAIQTANETAKRVASAFHSSLFVIAT